MPVFVLLAKFLLPLQILNQRSGINPLRMLQARLVLIVLLGCMLSFPIDVAGHDNDHTHGPERGKVAKIPWTTTNVLTNPLYIHRQFADTTLAGFQRYDFRYREGNFFASKGNTGHQTRSLFFNPRLNAGFRMLPHDFYAGYIVVPSEIRFYRPDHVFSEMFYVTGSANEQLFKAMHNQRLHERVYAGVLFEVVNSPGFYSRMEARNANLTLTLDAEPFPDHKVMAAFYVNRVINHESGGLSNHLEFEDDPVRDSVFMYAAESRYRELSFQLHQTYQPTISSVTDTLSEANNFSFGVFYHGFSYRRKAHVFDEPVSPKSFYDPGDELRLPVTFDSTVVHMLENTVGWSNTLKTADAARFPMQMHISLSHARISVQQPGLQSADPDDYDFAKNNFHQIKPAFVLRSNPERTVSVHAFAEGIIGGYNDKDISFGGRITGRHPSAHSNLSFGFAYAEQQAPYSRSYFRSNYVSWNNDFDKISTSHLQLQLETPLLNLQANYYQLQDAVILGTDARPLQLADPVQVVSLRLISTLQFGSFYTHNDIVFQSTEKGYFETFPSLLSYHSVFAQFSMFDGALIANPGLDLRYNNPYQPMAYMPMVRQFYVQQEHERDHDFLVDVFLNARISRVRLFVKLEHILGLFQTTSPVYSIPFYPLPETMFKFGASWMFFD